MRERSLQKQARALRAGLLASASRLLPTAEAAAAKGDTQLLRTVLAILRHEESLNATKTKLETAGAALELRAEIAGVLEKDPSEQLELDVPSAVGDRAARRDGRTDPEDRQHIEDEEPQPTSNQKNS